MYKAALALIAIGVLGICPAWAQAQTGAGAARNGDKASAYYHYSLAHMYADLASNGASGASRDNIREYLNKAIENYKEAIKADPSAPVLTEELAELYVGSGRLREAQSEAEEAIKQNPNDVNAHRMLARVFTSQIGDQQNHVDEAMLRKALEQYQKITELDTKDVDSLVMLGRLQRIVQKSADAEKSYRKALTIDPDNEEALVGLATALDDAGDHNGAADILKKLTEKNPSPEALLRLASSYEQMKEYGLAAETLSRALAANPPNAGELKRAMADYLDQAKKYDEALKVFQDLVKEEPRDAASFLRMSQIYSEMRNFSMAREMSNKAKAIEPDNLDVRLNEVGILEAEGKMPDAVSALKEILSTTVKRNYNPAERLVRGRLLRELAKLNTQMDQTDAAVEAYHQIADLDPDKAPETAALIINTYQVAKEYAKAEQEAEAALKKWPDDRSVRATHAFAIADMGRVDPAAAEIKKLLDGKNDRETYISLAQIYEKGRKYDDAAKALDQAEKLASTPEEKHDVWIARANLFDKMKKPEAVEAEYRKVLAADPQDAGALNDLGYMLADRNTRLPEALQMINKAIEEEPNNGAYLDSLGWVYFRLGRLPEAEESLRKALQFTPRDATVRDHMGEVLMKESKVKDAIAQWEISLKEWNASSPADLEPAEVAKVKNKLEGAKVRLAREGSRN
jgi:tetratricopeptide (TPR) repeat protein